MNASPADTPVAIGIDFGGTSVKIGVVCGAALLSAIEKIPTRDFTGPDDLLDAIIEKIGCLKERFPEVKAVGIGVPGAVFFSTGITYNLTNVPGWENVPLRDIMESRTGLPTVVDNDANCMAYAEWKFGDARRFENVVAVTLGTGVGGGLILGGRLYRGSQFAAGEIGQMSIDFEGVDGPYGNFGALERYVGNQQISELAAARFREAGREATPQMCAPEALADAACEGDEVARQVWRRVAEYLGTALASVIYLLNPGAIIIGGGVSHAGEVLFEPLKERIRSMLSVEFFESLHILPAEFGNDAGIIGSAALAAERVEERPVRQGS